MKDANPSVDVLKRLAGFTELRSNAKAVFLAGPQGGELYALRDGEDYHLVVRPEHREALEASAAGRVQYVVDERYSTAFSGYPKRRRNSSDGRETEFGARFRVKRADELAVLAEIYDKSQQGVM